MKYPDDKNIPSFTNFFIILIDNLLQVHQNSIDATEYNTSCSLASRTIYITLKSDQYLLI
jgi:hypothetical protein